MSKSIQYDKLDTWMKLLANIANEMEYSGDTSIEGLAEHIDSINDELEYKLTELLNEGPIVVFRGGTCVVRSATES